MAVALGPASLARANTPASVCRVNGVQCRGVRGATTVAANSREAVLEATTELLTAMLEANGISADDVASAFFTTTPDLTAEFPAVAARQMGWASVALLCGHEMNVPGSLPMCLRILLHVNTDKRADEIDHVYLRGARALRPEFEGRPG
ncbi:MAG: chorismate mutase [Chloroflexi bacterium]|nr:chorismate mutase [Chloroflexota bacterium]